MWSSENWTDQSHPLLSGSTMQFDINVRDMDVEDEYNAHTCPPTHIPAGTAVLIQDPVSKR